MATSKTSGIAYKFLTADGGTTHAGNGFRWPLPAGRKYGAWAEPITGELVACQNGYHLCERGALMEWLNARAFLCEWRGEWQERRLMQYLNGECR